MEEKPLVLVVDDDKDLLTLLHHVLEKANYQVSTTSDGNAAMAFVNKIMPDMIILDILMPGTDGYTLCNSIKRHPLTKNIPVIMLTALNSALNKKLAKEVGADGYITKPFDSQDLVKTVDQFLKPCVV